MKIKQFQVINTRYYGPEGFMGADVIDFNIIALGENGVLYFGETYVIDGNAPSEWDFRWTRIIPQIDPTPEGEWTTRLSEIRK